MAPIEYGQLEGQRKRDLPFRNLHDMPRHCQASNQEAGHQKSRKLDATPTFKENAN